MLDKTDNEVLTAALRYAARGWHVFPLKFAPDPDRPGRTIKKGYLSAAQSNGRSWGNARDDAQLRSYWSQFPDAQLGIAVGRDSGLFVIDIDTTEGHDVDGFASLAALEATHGPLPDTLSAISPTGSKHLFFYYPGCGELRSDNGRKLGPGIDVKGEGSMVAASPSKTAKGTYGWVDYETPIVLAPDWLLELLVEKEREKRDECETDPEVDPDRLRLALTFIDADDRPTWIKVTAGIKNTLGDDGEDMWTDWSQTSNKWKPKDAKTWHTVNCPEVTYKTIFYLAYEADPNWDQAYWRDLGDRANSGSDEWFDQGSTANVRSSFQEGNQKQEQPNQNAGASAFSNLFFTSGDFVKGYVPPDYVLDGIIQRGFLYALTGRSNEGKTAILHRFAANAALGTSLCGREIERTKVLYLAGENPDDHRMRWILLCDEMKVDPATMSTGFRSASICRPRQSEPRSKSRTRRMVPSA